MSIQSNHSHVTGHASQSIGGDIFDQATTSISTPRKRQKTVDMGLEAAAGLMTPPDSRHKRSTRASHTLSQEDYVDDEGRAGTDRSAKRRRVNSNIPTPNPPSAPFPTPRKIILRVRQPAEIATPPATPSTRAPATRNTQELPLTPESLTKQRKAEFDDLTPWKKIDALPAHLANLLALHKSFDLALSLHVATHPPVLPPLEPSLLQTHEYGLKSLDVELDALTNYVALKPMVEKSCGKRFGLSELKRLMWLWQWTGEDDEDDFTTVKPIRDSNNSPFLDETVDLASARRPTTSKSKSGNLMSCYSVTPTRTIDAATSRRVHTYGFGIRITLTPREAASACNAIHSMTDTFGNAGKAVGAVARWSAGSEARCKEVERRLWAWVDKNSKIENEVSTCITANLSMLLNFLLTDSRINFGISHIAHGFCRRGIESATYSMCSFATASASCREPYAGFQPRRFSCRRSWFTLPPPSFGQQQEQSFVFPEKRHSRFTSTTGIPISQSEITGGCRHCCIGFT